MKLRGIKLLLILFATLSILINSASAVTVTIITDDHVTGTPFLNNITGPFFGPLTSVNAFFDTTIADPNMVTNPDPASIFWENVNDTAAVGTVSNNTVGSSSVTFGFQNNDFFFQSFNTGFNIFDNPIVFGSNTVSQSVRNGEITGIAGMFNPTNLSGTGTNIFNSNNTATTSNWTTTAASTSGSTITTQLDTIAAYWITQEDVLTDPTLNTIFTEELFSDPGLNPLLSREGVIAHFVYILSIIEPNEAGDEWTLLYYDFSRSTSTDPGVGGDFEQVNFGTTFVSYDPGAIPTPIPAAIWLFGTGFLSMIAFARRRAKAQ